MKVSVVNFLSKITETVHMNLTNKTVLITGASSGIGQTTAIAFAKEGCSVMINYKTDRKAAEGVLKKCGKYSSGNMIVKADISSETAVKQMMSKIKKTFSTLHVLVNNAGIFVEDDHPTNIKAFETIYRNDFLGQIIVTKYALELMKKGKIINISSVHGRLGLGRPSAAAYASFKAAFENYTKNLAKYLAPNILVNAVAPGRVCTPMWGKLSPKEKKELGKVHLTRRMIEPEEVADSIVFLAKNDSMCAEILAIDGGYRLANLD